MTRRLASSREALKLRKESRERRDATGNNPLELKLRYGGRRLSANAIFYFLLVFEGFLEVDEKEGWDFINTLTPETYLLKMGA